MNQIAFFDLEVSQKNNMILDIGCIQTNESTFHNPQPHSFFSFIKNADYLCGHNIIEHDLKYLQKYIGDPSFGLNKAIDTLLLSPLLFPKSPYHHLLKDDKLQTEELNNPLNDSKKARDLFYAEVEAFDKLSIVFKAILFNLLKNKQGFKPFFTFLNFNASLSDEAVAFEIQKLFQHKICNHSDLLQFIQQKPTALAYALALLNCNDRNSITPPWVLKNYPEIEQLLFILCDTPCLTGCSYCNEALDPKKALKKYFGHGDFRKFDTESLQEDAVRAALHRKSILAVFPTGGGKSITFQVPALMSGENAKALTVIISPLQSLMKDQVDNLLENNITNAVTINGLLDPIERSKAIERVENGQANMLYISPESLRSVTIERLLLKRKIARFVIDEAHCFSSWGQDFRVDYLYIGDFIKNLQQLKNSPEPIPVSCFTATAKQKVIEDIQSYFQEKLNLNLELFKANTERKNLHYQVYNKETEDEKYTQLRSLIENNSCPTIVYVSRTKKAYLLAKKLTDDGFPAKPYHGKMDKAEKTTNQTDFMSGKVNIIVATSAFGMGVDKKDVGAVIHYDISDSLENYIQEAGRAGRDEKANAECYVLFNEEDLDKHFILLNQTKISDKEINQVWKAIKELTKTRERVSNSALEIARKAGWDESVVEIETRVKTAIAALEDVGYLKRGQNAPRIFANSILCKTAEEAITKINESSNFTPDQKDSAIRIIKKLFSSKSKRLSTDEEAESRVDYISEQLGIVKEKVIRILEILREEKILAQTKDLTAYIKKGENNKSLAIFNNYKKIEDSLLSELKEEEAGYNLKEINESIISSGIKDCSPNKIKTILNFWAVKNWIKKQPMEYSKNHTHISLKISKKEFSDKVEKRHLLSKSITDYLFSKSAKVKSLSEDVLIEFSVLELKEVAENNSGLLKEKYSLDDVEDTLFYLSRIESLKIEGGFLVIHNKLTIDRLEKNPQKRYTLADYAKLSQFYEQKVHQIHIVGEYAKKMISNYNEALQFVKDYFNLNYSAFLRKYFKGSRQEDIQRTLTPDKFRKLFGELSPSQLKIVKDSVNQNIVVAAGPGSGKTRVLVHKLASLLLIEDVKHDQLLMLTFSRSAATEFKQRLIGLIGNAANFIEIKTFHSYCFDLLGRVGNLSQSDSIIKTTIEKIKNNEIETSRITKTALVIDEAQDMNDDEFALVSLLIEKNEEIRVMLVGDDDQNIYEFRGSDSKYLELFIQEKKAEKYELIENYRSKINIVDFSNQWVHQIKKRLKNSPGFAKQKELGIINITEYVDDHLITPIASTIQKTDLSGSTCVLTRTNDEAAQLCGLLNQMGITAKLIQTNDSFNLNNLLELRYFTNSIDKYRDTPTIDNEDWKQGIEDLKLTYPTSTKLNTAFSIIQQFDLVNTVKKYKSDWKTFLFESKLEDFVKIDSETIYISTIHKAKGKEFDNIFLLLNNFNPASDELKRQLYVAITRAKNTLNIHYNGHYFRALLTDNLYTKVNNIKYTDPEVVSLLLTHKDVQLGYFEFVQHRMKDLVSGAKLNIHQEGLANAKDEVLLKFSTRFKETLSSWQSKGYQLKTAVVNYIIYWKKPEEEKEFKIILPELLLTK